MSVQVETNELLCEILYPSDSHKTSTMPTEILARIPRVVENVMKIEKKE